MTEKEMTATATVMMMEMTGDVTMTTTAAGLGTVVGVVFSYILREQTKDEVHTLQTSLQT
jgi:H+/Cl- antiporter ClcA